MVCDKQIPLYEMRKKQQAVRRCDLKCKDTKCIGSQPRNKAPVRVDPTCTRHTQPLPGRQKKVAPSLVPSRTLRAPPSTGGHCRGGQAKASDWANMQKKAQQWTGRVTLSDLAHASQRKKQYASVYAGTAPCLCRSRKCICQNLWRTHM